MTRVEIRLMEKESGGNVGRFIGFIGEVQDMDVPDSVEKVFQEWIEERVKGDGSSCLISRYMWMASSILCRWRKRINT